jgi:hypothetical protein
MSDLTKPNNWTEEETQNVVNVFFLAFERRQETEPSFIQKGKSHRNQ